MMHAYVRLRRRGDGSEPKAATGPGIVFVGARRGSKAHHDGSKFPLIPRHICRPFALTVSHPLSRLLRLADQTDARTHRRTDRTENISHHPSLALCVPSSSPCDHPDHSPSPPPSPPSEHSQRSRTPPFPSAPLRPPHHPARRVHPMLPRQPPRCRCLRASGRRIPNERA
jgi:hypothetical protein